MKKLIFAGLMTLLALSAVWAQSVPTATVSWLGPVKYTDTSLVSVNDLDHYTLTWTATTAGGPSGSMSLPGAALSAIVPFPCGSATFAITVTTTASSKYPNATSGASSPVIFDSGVACATNPPSDLAVQFSGVTKSR
jgi:hypothetical protein